MNIGIIILCDDAETCWNAPRYANFCVSRKDEVKVFFMGRGVEYQKISTDKFNTVEQAEKLFQSGGKIFARGVCMQSREQEESAMCPISTMKDMDSIVRESDKVLTF